MMLEETTGDHNPVITVYVLYPPMLFHGLKSHHRALQLVIARLEPKQLKTALKM